MEILADIEQGSPEWHMARYGWITASCFSKVLAKGAGKTRKGYMLQLASEILTGALQGGFTSDAMQWGTETEPQARAMYELNTGSEVVEVGFVRSGDHVGCSPDGLVGDDGLVEFKCPNTTTQIETFLSGKMPTGHIPHVQGDMGVCERDWCDFVSFDPRIDGECSYFSVRVMRDDEYIANLSLEVDRFKDDLNGLLEKLR